MQKIQEQHDELIPWLHGFASLKVPVAVDTKPQQVAHLKRQAT